CFSFRAFGELIVSSGTTCTLFGVMVTGNVQVQRNARLIVPPNATVPTTINGNLQIGTGASIFVAFTNNNITALTVHGNFAADHCNTVDFSEGGPNNILVNVGGNVQITNCTEFVNSVASQFGGNFNCSNNSVCGLGNSSANGNAQINNNGGGSVQGNTI